MTTTALSTSGTTARSGARLLPLTGIAVALAWIAARIVPDGILQGTTHNLITNATTAEQMILDHQIAELVEVIATFFLAALIILFAAQARRVLGDSATSMTAFGCAVLFSATLVLTGTVSFAELAAAHHHDSAALVTLSYLVAFSFAWKGIAIGAFLLAFGWAALKSEAWPRWFAILTLVLSVPGLVAIGYVLLWLLAPVWFALAAFKVKPQRPRAAPGGTAGREPRPDGGRE